MRARAWFPEPEVPDPTPTPIYSTELLGSYLARSTHPRAVEVRAYYNAALDALPTGCAETLHRRLVTDATLGARFELHVGRFLQERGATAVECEPELPGGRRVDWRATFPDGVLHVEAMVPVYNATAGVQTRRHLRLLEAIDKRAPEGWWLMPFRLPALPEDAPLGPFTRVVEELVARLPPADTVASGEVLQLDGRVPGLDRGRVLLTAGRATRTAGGVGSGAAVSYADNSALRIAAAWRDRRKRRQGRAAPAPALLGILGGLGADLDDYDAALFGGDRRPGQPATGVMVERDPPWAGVLAFPTWSEAAARDPVLYLAPAYAGELPAAVSRLEVRRLVEGVLTVREPRDRDVMVGARWAAP